MQYPTIQSAFSFREPYRLSPTVILSSTDPTLLTKVNIKTGCSLFPRVLCRKIIWAVAEKPETLTAHDCVQGLLFKIDQIVV